MMLHRQTISLVAALLATAGLAIGCGETSGPRRSTQTSSSASSSGSTGGMGGEGGAATGGGGGNAGGMGGTAGMGGSGGSGGAPPLGDITIVDVPDTACAKIVGTSVQLYADGSENAPAFNILSTVGAKRLAGGKFVPGFATFGLDGSSPSPAVVGLDPDFDLVTSEGSTIGLVAVNGTAIRFQRYASNDAPMGNPVDLLTLGQTFATGTAIAGDATGGSLVVWAETYTDPATMVTTTNMAGRYVDSAGNASAPFKFAEGLSTNGVTTAMTRSGNSFALAWSASENGKARTRFARLNQAGLVGNIAELTGDAQVHYVEKIVTTSSGHALLMRKESIVVVVDADGKPTGPAHRYLGTNEGWDIAVAGTNLAIVAKRVDGTAAFRPLNDKGEPAGDWKCLDAPSSQIYDIAAIDGDGMGYAIVYRTPGGGEKFVRTNLTGTAAP